MDPATNNPHTNSFIQIGWNNLSETSSFFNNIQNGLPMEGIQEFKVEPQETGDDIKECTETSNTTQENMKSLVGDTQSYKVKSVHKCRFCDFASKFESDFETHMMLDHPNDSLIQLEECLQADTVIKLTLNANQSGRSNPTCSLPDQFNSFPPEVVIKQEIKNETQPLIKEEPKDTDAKDYEEELDKEWQCDLCEKMFPKRSLRNKHEAKFHSFVRNEPEKDEEERRKDYRKKYDRKKKLQEERGKIFKCAYCEKTFKDGTNRGKHQANMHTNPKMPVEMEDDGMPKLINGKLVPVHPEPVNEPVVKTDFHCIKCDKYLAKADYLSQHLKMVHHQCDKCEETFDDKAQLLKHTKSEHPVIEYKTCHLCGYRTDSKNTYFNKHMKMVHGKEKRFGCTECPKRFARKNGLERHVEGIHRQMKNNVCTGCNYSTPWKANIVRHIKVAHLKIKDVLCSLCPFVSNSHRNLRCHMKAVHHKIKDNKCEEPDCTFASAQIQGLRRHKEEVHGKLKKNFCGQCSFRSYQKSSLETHVNSVHLGVRNFPCPTCDRKPFKLKGTLVAHIRKRHKDNPEAMDEILKIQPNMKVERDFEVGLEDTTDETMSKFHTIQMPFISKLPPLEMSELNPALINSRWRPNPRGRPPSIAVSNPIKVESPELPIAFDTKRISTLEEEQKRSLTNTAQTTLLPPSGNSTVTTETSTITTFPAPAENVPSNDAESHESFEKLLLELDTYLPTEYQQSENPSFVNYDTRETISGASMMIPFISNVKTESIL